MASSRTPTRVEPNCIFCKIVAGKLSSYNVAELDDVVAFLDINPASKGHTLLVTREHFVQVNGMNSADAGRLFEHVPSIANALLEETGAQGFNIVQNSGAVAGQEVMHVHVHIVPRTKGDGVKLNTGGAPAASVYGEDPAAFAGRVKDRLARK